MKFTEVRKIKTKGKELIYNLVEGELFSRTCSKCLEIKTVDNFYKNEKRYLGYYPVCIICKINLEKLLYEQNSLEYSKRSRNYYIRNKEKIKFQSSNWRKSNSKKYNEYMYARDRDNRQKSITSNFLKELRLKYKECREYSEQQGIKYTVDHIIPLKGKNVSGLNVPWNIQFLTKIENSRKSNKWDGTYENNSWRKDYE